MGTSELIVTDDAFVKTVILSSQNPFPIGANGHFILPVRKQIE